LTPSPSTISAPVDTSFDHFLPSLCTPTVQVPDMDVNPIQERKLYKQEDVKWLVRSGFKDEAYRLESCGQTFVHLKCSKGHEKYVKTHCNREYCPTCGAKGSRLHKKRATRARDRLMWAPVLGYLVLTLPDQISASRPDRDTLNHLQKKTHDILQRHFDMPGGMIRIHFVGKQTGKLHIHINALFPILHTNGIGKIDPQKLTSIRKDWTNFINSFFDLSLDDTDVFYNFAVPATKKHHKIKYVLRPVVGALEFYSLTDEDKRYILSLKGWQNTRWFGKLANGSYKKYLIEKGINPTEREDKDPYLSRLCPCCGGRFRYQGVIHKNDLPIFMLRRIDHDVLVDFEIYAALKEKERGAK